MPTPDPMEPLPELDRLISAIRRSDDDSLEELSSAVRVAKHLDKLADQLLEHFVDRARRSGASWTEIGRSMGVTKQAAQKRFVPSRPTGGRGDGFRRFDEAARSAMVAAHDEAQTARSGGLTPAHLLLGLISEPDAPAAQLLKRLGVSVRDVRAAATEALPAPTRDVADVIPYDPDARSVLEAALRRASRPGQEQVGIEHLLLALLEVEEGNGPLSSQGVTAEAVEGAVGEPDSSSD